MRFPTPLVAARLVRRYKRFLADIVLDDGTTATAHVANPGSMMGLDAPGLRIWVEDVRHPKRKLGWAWRLAELPGGAMVGVDTGAPNRLIKAALAADALPDLAGYPIIQPEVPYGAASRVDFLLRGGGRPDCWLEVKSVTLSRQPGLAEFPDSVTKRGTTHLQELADRVRAGDRAVLCFVLQRDDCSAMQLAADIDPAYARAYAQARAAGVEVLVLPTRSSRLEIRLADPLAAPSPEVADASGGPLPRDPLGISKTAKDPKPRDTHDSATDF